MSPLFGVKCYHIFTYGRNFYNQIFIIADCLLLALVNETTPSLKHSLNQTTFIRFVAAKGWI